MRVSTTNGSNTKVDEIGVNACKVEYEKVKQAVVCDGIGDGTDVAVYNPGGVVVGSAVASGSCAAVSLAGQPQGAYILVIKEKDTVRAHRFIKW